MSKLTITLDNAQKSWIDKMVQTQGVSIRELYRRLTQAAMQADWNPQKSLEMQEDTRVQNLIESSQKLSKKERFVLLVRELYSLELAAEKAEATVKEVDKWLSNDEFHQRVTFARSLFLAETEKSLKDVGEGLKTGNATALASFLSANHSSYGTVRKKSFDAIMGDLIDSIGYHVEQEFSKFEGGREAIKRFTEKVVSDTKHYRNQLPD